MKRFMLLSAVVLFSLRSFGEVSLGLNFSSEFTNNASQQNQNNRTNSVYYDLTIEPTLLILISEMIEVAPFAGFTFGSQANYTNDDQINKNSNSGFNFGCGLNFRIIGNELIRFSIGPRVAYEMSFVHDSDEYTLTPSFGAPANIDLQFNDRFFMRLSPLLAEIKYQHHSYGQDRYNGEFKFNIITQTGSSIGFFITF